MWPVGGMLCVLNAESSTVYFSIFCSLFLRCVCAVSAQSVGHLWSFRLRKVHLLLYCLLMCKLHRRSTYTITHILSTVTDTGASMCESCNMQVESGRVSMASINYVFVYDVLSCVLPDNALWCAFPTRGPMPFKAACDP